MKKAKSIELKNTILSLDNQGKLNIVTKVKKPSCLIKYYELNNYSIKGLTNNTIYFSHAYMLNDIMDGNFRELWDFKDFPEEKTFINDYSNFQKGLIDDIYNEVAPEFLKFRGIFSLCDNYKNELLWSHYTKEKGFAYEFNYKKLETYFKKYYKNTFIIYPISYQKLSRINFNDYVSINEKRNVNVNIPIAYAFSVKDLHWKYEKEWRILMISDKFNNIVSPQTIIDSNSKSKEKILKESRNISIEQDIIDKVFLAPLFFNNERFNKVSLVKSSVISKYTYYFSNTKNTMLYDFFKALRDKHNHKIFFMNKTFIKGYATRKPAFKIKIIELTKNYVVLSSKEIT